MHLALAKLPRSVLVYWGFDAGFSLIKSAGGVVWVNVGGFAVVVLLVVFFLHAILLGKDIFSFGIIFYLVDFSPCFRNI